MKKQERKVKIRKSVRNTYILILVLIIMMSVIVLYKSFNSANKKSFVKANIYEYNNKSEYSYDVNIVENDYIDKDNVGEENVFITNLMDNVDITMKYQYLANQSSDIKYTYQITGFLEATYTKDGQEQKVWRKTDVILPMADSEITSDYFEIEKSFNLNIKEKIDTIKAFQEELGMQVEAKYTVYLGVTVNTNVLGKEITNVYSPDIVFEIGPKTTVVKSNVENSERPQIVTKMVQENDEAALAKKTVATITLVLATGILIILLVKTNNSNIVRNEYKLELNKIIRSCEEKLVEANSRIDIEGQKLVDVREFEEVLKVSEELFKPILYWNNDEEEETWFCVSGDNTVYRFILKR